MTQAIQAMVKGQFLNPAPLLSDMGGDAIADLITAAADVVLILDRDGIIRDMAVGNEDMLDAGADRGDQSIALPLPVGQRGLVLVAAMHDAVLDAEGLEPAFDHRAIALDAAIDRRRGIGDLRVFTAIEQTVITPATGRFRQLGSRRRQQCRRASQADQQPKK